MRTVLLAIRKSPSLQLQIVATGMHLDRRHGHTIDEIRVEGWRIDAVAPWKAGSRSVATGLAIAEMAKLFERIEPQIVLVVGDRVEALAAATAAHLSEIAVAHVHGGDRALGQMDDCIRHTISKLAHVHFPATEQSARRLARMGEDRWRIHCLGSPGIDGIVESAASRKEIAAIFPGLAPRKFALVLLHPVDADDAAEFARAQMVSGAIEAAKIDRAVVVYPNSDPGSAGIIRHWQALRGDRRFIIRADIPRPIFLGLLRDAAMLVGNSSSGIIEAASFRTPVIDIGPRQLGRERARDVRNVPYRLAAIRDAARASWNGGRAVRGVGSNPYGGRGTGKRIAAILAKIAIDQRLLRKMISY